MEMVLYQKRAIKNCIGRVPLTLESAFAGRDLRTRGILPTCIANLDFRSIQEIPDFTLNRSWYRTKDGDKIIALAQCPPPTQKILTYDICVGV